MIATTISDSHPKPVRLTEVEKKSLQKEVSQNITAYDYFLRAREIFNKSNGTKIDMENALRLVNLAIQLDSNFSRAYALKGSIWYNLSSLGVSQKTWHDSAMYFSAKAISADASSPDGYIVQGDVHRSLGKLDLAKADYYNAYKIAPNDPSVLLSYGWQLMIERDERGADLILKSNENQFSLKDPEYYMALSRSYA